MRFTSITASFLLVHMPCDTHAALRGLAPPRSLQAASILWDQLEEDIWGEQADDGAASSLAWDASTDTPGPAAVDCVVSQWQPWQPCSVSCGGEDTTQKRYRSIAVPPQHGGGECVELEDERECGLAECPRPYQPLAPEGPSQQCANDAGPAWTDDADRFPGTRWHAGFPVAPVLPASGACPLPLEDACAAKGAKAAFLDGPVDCGGRGWFCRIVPQAGYTPPGFVGLNSDLNFAHCNATDADLRTDAGHCHGSDADDTYGWWARDHHFRGYRGHLHCCCGWDETAGVVNRCDYRRRVLPGTAGQCVDANEGHGRGYDPEGGCAAQSSGDAPFVDPLYAEPEQCWSVVNFGD